MANIANELWNDFVSLIFPENCISCGKLLVRGEDHLCTSCRIQLPVLDRNTLTDYLSNKFSYEPKITFVDSFLKFKKGGVTQKLLHELKYRGNQELGLMLGAWYGSRLQQNGLLSGFDMLVPVPLHPRKLRVRGYNQSMAIAEGLASVTSLSVDSQLLIRTKFTSTQTKKHKVDRWKNMDRIFAVPDRAKVSGKSILLIDDVLTTGSTLASCASELVASDAREVGICTLAVSLK